MTGHSCLYEGSVQHGRRTPVAHAFRMRVFMMYIDLGEVDTVFSRRLLWSTKGPALFRWRREDHPGDSGQPLDAWVRTLVATRTGTHPRGPVRLLTHPRQLGVGFNPLSVYYCFAPDGVTLEWAVLEVTSTPWGERAHHVLDVRGGGDVHEGRVAKTLHVSPFLPMGLDYRWRLTVPGRTIAVAVDVLEKHRLVLRTSVTMRRRELTAPMLARLTLSHLPMTWRVLGGIHWQALWLWRKRVPYHPHPRHIEETHAAA